MIIGAETECGRDYSPLTAQWLSIRGRHRSKYTCRLIEIYLVTRAIETAWPATVSNGSRTLLRTLA